ncbi:MAG TPA: M81 family metallopeptidase [Prosthecobacter sp.]|mgnify:CR=1 FL=1|nr:M81 family metallopeptidase [Prosthecobacter sp.]
MKLPLLSLLALTVCAHAAPPPRIAVMQLRHETVTFLPNETTREDFIYPGSPAKGEALLKTQPTGDMGGFVKVAREYGAVLAGIESPGMPETGIGSGWVTRDAYEHFTGRMIEELKAQGPFDGVYLALHGAMAVRGIARPEAELARRVREVAGAKAVIAGTFDPHGNEDAEFLKHADLAFAYKYYPHYDAHLQGERAARMMIRAIRGDYRPARAVRTVPILSATVYQWTGQHPWSTLVQRCLTWEAREPDVYVNFFYGFPWADVPDAGMCFQVITNGDAALAKTVADDLADTAWRMRAEMFSATPIHPVAEAVGQVKKALEQGRAPAVLADYSDRSGNATWVLREVIAQDLAKVVIATIKDDRALNALARAGAKQGDAFDMDVGGYVDESAGQPVRVKGVIEHLSSDGKGGVKAARIRFGRGNLLMLSPQLVQYMDPQSIRKDGVDITQFEVFAIKSRVHFRRGFDDNGFAKTILLVEPPGPFMGTVHLDALRYENLRVREFYPFSEK